MKEKIQEITKSLLTLGIFIPVSLILILPEIVGKVATALNKED